MIERRISTFERTLYRRDLRYLHPRDLHRDGPDGGAHPRGLGLPLRQDLFETHIRMEFDILGADECWPCPVRDRWPMRSARERSGLDVCFTHLVDVHRVRVGHPLGEGLGRGPTPWGSSLLSLDILGVLIAKLVFTRLTRWRWHLRVRRRDGR